MPDVGRTTSCERWERESDLAWSGQVLSNLVGSEQKSQPLENLARLAGPKNPDTLGESRPIDRSNLGDVYDTSPGKSRLSSSQTDIPRHRTQTEVRGHCRDNRGDSAPKVIVQPRCDCHERRGDSLSNRLAMLCTPEFMETCSCRRIQADGVCWYLPGRADGQMYMAIDFSPARVRSPWRSDGSDNRDSRAGIR